MDDLTVREFLYQIGPDFARFADHFIRHKFTNVASLRCLKIPDDIKYIFGNDLSLGELRQMEYALNELSQVDKNTSKPTEKVDNPVIRTICKSTEEKIRGKKRELHEEEQNLAELEMPIPEPTPQGSLNYRCANCHVRGHKADNNKGNTVCQNEKCVDYKSCGQKEKHREYRDDKKKIQNRIKNLKHDITDLEEELVRATAYEAKSGKSFTKVVKDRLRKTNPSKYAQASLLMKDLMTLKTAYDNSIPPVSQNDGIEFPRKILEVNSKIKREYYSDSSSNSNTDSPPTSKKMCTVTPQKGRKTAVRQQMHMSDYVCSPNPYPINYNPTYLPSNVVFGFPFLNQQMSAGFNSVAEFQHMQQNMYNPFPPHTANAFQIPQQYAPFITNSNVTNNASSDEEDEEDDTTKPKIWSPAFM